MSAAAYAVRRDPALTVERVEYAPRSNLRVTPCVWPISGSIASGDTVDATSIDAAEKDALAERALFSPNERLAILLGSRDPRCRIPAAFGLRWICRSLFGIRPPPPLADQRLEALRLLTIALRRRRSVARAIHDAALAGVPRSQIDALIGNR